MEDLRGKVVVVTGASSGIGRETAVQFAARGCAVALAARGEEGLDETERLCVAAFGEALVVVCDVSREADVVRLADSTLARWGKIDIWVNNAGVTLFAPLTEGPFEDHRRVIETNLFGAIFGARAAVPIFRRQGSGTLINVGSVLSKVGNPFVPSYTISKFGLRGMSEALRAELADEPDIHVCYVLPYAVGTPHFEGGANEVGRKAYALPPAQSPEKVARAIVRLAGRPRRELHVPAVAALGVALHKVLPNSTEKLLLRAIRRFHLRAAGSATAGNLFRPTGGAGAVHGERSPQVHAPAFAAWSVLSSRRCRRRR